MCPKVFTIQEAPVQFVHKTDHITQSKLTLIQFLHEHISFKKTNKKQKAAALKLQKGLNLK